MEKCYAYLIKFHFFLKACAGSNVFPQSSLGTPVQPLRELTVDVSLGLKAGCALGCLCFAASFTRRLSEAAGWHHGASCVQVACPPFWLYLFH